MWVDGDSGRRGVDRDCASLAYVCSPTYTNPAMRWTGICLSLLVAIWGGACAFSFVAVAGDYACRLSDVMNSDDDRWWNLFQIDDYIELLNYKKVMIIIFSRRKKDKSAVMTTTTTTHERGRYLELL